MLTPGENSSFMKIAEHVSVNIKQCSAFVQHLLLQSPKEILKSSYQLVF